MSSSSNGFWSRWQARRNAVAAEAAEQPLEVPAAIVSQEPAIKAAQINQVDSSARADDNTEVDQLQDSAVAEPLPDPEGIEIGGSFARFMAKDVDPATRTTALRALWRQPQFNEVDGLMEYALDYTKHPKLSSGVSAELTKRVFQHLVDKVTDGAEEMLAKAGSSTTSPLANQKQPDRPDLLASHGLDLEVQIAGLQTAADKLPVDVASVPPQDSGHSTEASGEVVSGGG